MMIPTEMSGTQWQLKLANGSSVAYMLFIGTKNGQVYLNESSNENATDADGNVRRTSEHAGIAPAGEWFRLRIEYIPNGTKATVNLYVDDEPIVENSDLVYGSHRTSYTSPQSVGATVFQAFKNMNTDIFIDDLYFGKFEP